MGEQLFERRELTRVLAVPAKYVQRNIKGSLLAQMGAHVEGRCGVEGYIQPKSAVILDYSLGKVDMLHSGVRYRVRFHADICYPHKGQTFKAPVTFRSKIGVHAEIAPIKVLLPRDLHIGNTDFENITEGTEIVFEVLGSEFKQNDDAIFVLGRLVEVIGAEAKPEVAPVVEEKPEGIAESGGGGAGGAGGDEVKQIAFKPAAPAEPRRRKRLGAAASLQVNVGEPAAEGTA
jgi:DNA-directed RNA polymerase subunit E'/Rpb7